MDLQTWRHASLSRAVTELKTAQTVQHQRTHFVSRGIERVSGKHNTLYALKSTIAYASQRLKL